jgi:hypothetical protein
MRFQHPDQSRDVVLEFVRDGLRQFREPGCLHWKRAPTANRSTRRLEPDKAGDGRRVITELIDDELHSGELIHSQDDES